MLAALDSGLVTESAGRSNSLRDDGKRCGSRRSSDHRRAAMKSTPFHPANQAPVDHKRSSRNGRPKNAQARHLARMARSSDPSSRCRRRRLLPPGPELAKYRGPPPALKRPSTLSALHMPWRATWAAWFRPLSLGASSRLSLQPSYAGSDHASKETPRRRREFTKASKDRTASL